ncbi:MAG: hypothetical protein II973_07830 [Spirochaetaceae bacterium]|nr:hypothetical protein [Spirochaetaceae bacterium]
MAAVSAQAVLATELTATAQRTNSTTTPKSANGVQETGGGFGGNGGTLGGVSDIYINGNPSLDVTGYTFNGTTYSDVESLVKAVFDRGTTEDVFYVNFMLQAKAHREQRA